MKVILTQTVPGLGEAGTIKEVADGYARNYLLPRNMAIAATKTSMKQAEAQAESIARKVNKARTEAEKAASGIEGKTVVIRARAGSENRLYGSVTPADVAEALSAQHSITVDRRKVELGEPIHRLGTYTATVDVGNGVTASFTVEVAPEVAGAHGKATRAGGEEAEAEAEGEQAGEAPAPAASPVADSQPGTGAEA
jgi:large subunit ribosomal protein L9